MTLQKEKNLPDISKFQYQKFIEDLDIDYALLSKQK